MASGSYAIKGLQLADIKRVFKVKANRQQARAGDVIKFTITATGVSDRTVRSYYIEGVAPEDLADQKTGGLFYLRQGEAEVYVQIAPDYDNDKDVELVFNVVDSKSTLFRIKRPPQAKVLIKGDGEPSQERDRKRLKDQNRKRIQQGKDGQLTRQDPIQRVRVSEQQQKALKYGVKQLPGMRQRALPAGRPRALPGVRAPKALPPVGGMPASSQIVDITPISKSVRPMGGSLARSGGGALARSGGAGAMRGVRAPGALGVATAGMEFGSRMSSGQNVVQAGAGTAASVGGGIAGMKAGAAAGAALGSIVPGIGTAIGGILGGVLGGMGGSMLASKATDTVTGANRQEFAEGGHIIPKMTDMPFNLPGLKGSFNEPGNPEMLSITPLDDPLKAAQSISGIASAAGGMLPGMGMLGGILPGMGMLGGIGSAVGGGLKNIFGGKEKEYKGIASAIGAEMEKRGIGDPLGLKGGKSFGNSVRDLLDKIPGIKDIFGKRDGNTQGQQQGTSPGGGQMSNVAGSTAERNAAAFLSTLEGTSGQNAADAMQVMLNRTADAQAGGSMSAYGSTLFDQITGKEQFSPFSAAIYGTSADPDAAAKYGPLAQQLGSSPEERKQRLLQIAGQPDGMQQLEKLFKGGSASAAGEVLNDFATGGSLSQTAAQGIGSKVSFRGYSRGLPADRFNRGTGGNYFFDNSSTGKVGSLSDVSQSPAMQQPQGAGQTVVLAGGTNSAGDPVGAGRDMMNSIKNLKEKGYRVVVVPPNQKEYPAAYGAIKSAAKNEGAIVEEGTYEISDPLHLTSQFSSQLNSKYAGAIFMGDSNAARIAGDRGLKNVRREGAGTGEILQQAQKMQRAPAANNQLNPGVQQMSYSPSAAGTQAASNAAVQPQTPMQPTAMLEGAGTFVQGNSGSSRGPHFHIGPEQELWGKPEGKAEVRRASFKIAKALINKGEHFSFTNANINIDPNNPPDDATLMKYVEQEQIAHAGRDGGGSFGGIDIAGKPGLRLPLGVSNYKESSTGFGNTATIAGTRAFVAHGMTGSGNTPGANALAPGASPSNGVQLMSNTSPAAPAGNPEDFFKFAFGAQGRESSYTAPPNAAPTALLEASSNTAMASAGPKVAIVNNPVSNSANVSNGGGSQSQQSSRGSDMSDAGLLAYMAKQRLLTLGA
tara:strand:- start:5861 stop:9337 length:3477 start_codon:yes stop_codon:yes gene_type:complete